MSFCLFLKNHTVILSYLEIRSKYKIGSSCNIEMLLMTYEDWKASHPTPWLRFSHAIASTILLLMGIKGLLTLDLKFFLWGPITYMFICAIGHLLTERSLKHYLIHPIQSLRYNFYYTCRLILNATF